MSQKDMGKRILWAARLMAFLFVMLLVIVSLDSFSGAGPVSRKLVGFTTHVMPALAVLLVLLIYWRNLFYSGIAFLVISVAFTVFFKTYNNIYSFIFLSIPLAIIALMFIGAEATTKTHDDKSE